MYYFVNEKNAVRFASDPWDFISLYLILLTFAMRLKSANGKSHWNVLIFCDHVRFEYVHYKNVWFCFVSIVWFHFSHKIENFQLWKSLKYFNMFWFKKLLDLNMSHGKMSDFVSFPLFGFTLVIKLRNSDFESN